MITLKHTGSIFEIEGLYWDHSPDKNLETCFFKNLNLKIPRGKTIAFVGPSGCGKTTLLQILGLVWERAPLKGSINYEGTIEYQNFLSLKSADKNKIRLNDFGFVLQNSYLIPHFQVNWNIALPLLLRGESSRSALKKASELLDKFPGLTGDTLDQLARTSVDKLSQGQRQRVACIRAVAGNPKVLFADEPISNLDNKNAKYLLNFLKKHKPENQTLLLINHNIEATNESLEPDFYFYIEKKLSGTPSHIIHEIPREDLKNHYDNEKRKWEYD